MVGAFGWGKEDDYFQKKTVSMFLGFFFSLKDKIHQSLKRPIICLYDP